MATALRRNNGGRKDAAQGVAGDVTQDVAKGVFGAAEDGGVKAFMMPILIFQRRNPPIYISPR